MKISKTKQCVFWVSSKRMWNKKVEKKDVVSGKYTQYKGNLLVFLVTGMFQRSML